MEIICNITEILNTDKKNHKKNRFYHPERVIITPKLIHVWTNVMTRNIYLLVYQ